MDCHSRLIQPKGFQNDPPQSPEVEDTSPAGQDSPPFLQASDPSAKIQQTLSVKSSPHLRPSLFAQIASSLPLGWSHYVELLTLDDPSERRFYEIEAAANQWTVRELQRQIASSLYQRLALSRDKDETRRLASEGQVVEKAADLIKKQTPRILEVERARITLAQGEDLSPQEIESLTEGGRFC